MKLGIAQTNTRPGDLERSAARIRTYARMAAKDGADLLVLPSCALTGYELVREADQVGFLRDLVATLASLAADVACPCLVSVLVGVEGVGVQEPVLLKDGSVRLLGMSGSLADLLAKRDDAPRDELATKEGPPLFDIAGERVAVSTSPDDLDRLRGRDKGATVVVYLDDQGFCVDDPASALGAAVVEGGFVQDARDMSCWLCGVGGVGLYGERVFGGSSFVLSPAGTLVACGPAFEEGLVLCSLDERAPVDPSRGNVLFDQTFHLWQVLTLGLHDMVGKYGGGRPVVLGLDGTLSASLLALLATDALGPTRVHVLVSARRDEDARRSRELAGRLRLDVQELDDALVRAAQGDEALQEGIAQARIAAWARELDGLVLSSRDKTDLALGLRSQLPTAAFALPLGDVYRSDILDLARLRNTISPVLGKAQLTRADLPDLPGLTLLGPSVEETVFAIDAILLEHLEGRHGLRDVSAVTGRSPAYVSRVLEALDEAEPWRVGTPLVIATSSAPLADSRTSLGLAWRPDGSLGDQALRDDLARLSKEALMGAAGDGAPAPPEAGPSAADVAGQLSEVMTLLGDLANSGLLPRQNLEGLQEWLGARRAGKAGDRPAGGVMLWGPPFSEN
ncbi:nitrilase-related carbon-nitrogen hydrolase [Olsenella massiliensis]|uniref:nitrilase-related carbon-nitrogen hydrolase n=1 Tax=Olsenella massiliensis TaxID=1622075 RepID=UPI00071D968D|nr:nitrilase-related carbon-nitrogen hydrolase [Olsenella massiliensis]